MSKKVKVVGEFISNPRGFGFVKTEEYDEDIYIPEEYVHGAFPSDTVEVELLTETTGKRREGRIRNILTRGIQELIGTYQAEHTFGFVIPDNNQVISDIFIPIEHNGGAVTGDKVVVKLTDYGNAALRKKPEGRVSRIIGNINDPGVDILSIVEGFEIPHEFPEKVINQENRCPDTVSEADMYGRKDLRDLQMVTIDGEDAKDLDDAVSLSVDEKGLFHLGVHIADVSNYVQESSALDREALKRGTSVYLVDRVIPMLPHRLSNGICSLNQGEDRLTLSCFMTIDSKGNVVDHDITESVINVDRRMSYTDVAAILEDRDEETIDRYREFVPMFEEMAELSRILRQKRQGKGAIDFDFPESKIILDEEGNPVDIVPHERNTATKLIEDFMLAANETVAEHFFYMQSPFVYRIHEQPDPDKINSLRMFAGRLGYNIRTRRNEGVTPGEIQKLLESVKGSKEEAVISRMTLRSMMQAKYSTECTGHFGLSFDYYCHFTSPIRRYPDLQIHRIIKDYLRERMNERKLSHYEEILPEVAKHSSETERRAQEAERETDKLKKAQYMENHLGETFTGVVSGVTAWGLFVELDNSCEGLVRAVSMEDDFYIYDEENMRLVGERTGREFVLGQKVDVRVFGADRITRTIEFRLNDNTDFEYEARSKDDSAADNESFDNECDNLAKLNHQVIHKKRDKVDNRAAKVRRLSREAMMAGLQNTSHKQEEMEAPEELYEADNEKVNDEYTVSYENHRRDDFWKKERSVKVKSKTDDKEKKSGRKIYKVHKYKKSATSKSARSAQGKGRKKR
ncbi:MAG: ribonuclease R [Butyrivibrio sp.]|nr:ribonuclease R [Butyrivibrio sp.]